MMNKTPSHLDIAQRASLYAIEISQTKYVWTNAICISTEHMLRRSDWTFGMI